MSSVTTNGGDDTPSTVAGGGGDGGGEHGGPTTQMRLGKAILSLNDPSNEVVIQGLVYFLKEADKKRSRHHGAVPPPPAGRCSVASDLTVPPFNAFVRAYYQASPRFLELFNALDKPSFSAGGQETINIVKAFAALLGGVPTSHAAPAVAASKRLLSSRYASILTSAFGATSRVGLACATMQLLARMAGLRHRSLVRQLVNAFNFTQKTFLQLGHAGGVGVAQL